MGKYDYPIECAEALVKDFSTRDPKKIAKELGIAVVFDDKLIKLKGLYYAEGDIRLIGLKGDLPKSLIKAIIAHELGHDQLHRKFTADASFIDHFKEYSISSIQNTKEVEANIFAASLLISDEELLNLVKVYQYDINQIASILEVDKNIVAIKAEILRDKGYKFNLVEYDRNFLI